MCFLCPDLLTYLKKLRYVYISFSPSYSLVRENLSSMFMFLSGFDSFWKKMAYESSSEENIYRKPMYVSGISTIHFRR